eukprot:349898-Chlamydomonas_euryale.AAC.6
MITHACSHSQTHSHTHTHAPAGHPQKRREGAPDAVKPLGSQPAPPPGLPTPPSKAPAAAAGGSSGFAEVLALAGAVQGGRNVAQTLALNTVFVATGGNLAASFVASVANAALFSLLQRNALERTRRRSAELARDLHAFNTKLRAIQDRQRRARATRAAASDGRRTGGDEEPDEPGLERLRSAPIPASSSFSRATEAELVAAVEELEATKRRKLERLAPPPAASRPPAAADAQHGAATSMAAAPAAEQPPKPPAVAAAQAKEDPAPPPTDRLNRSLATLSSMVPDSSSK